MQERPSELTDEQPARRSFRPTAAWLLPVLPLVAALILVSWPIPSAATGTLRSDDVCPEVLRAVFPPNEPPSLARRLLIPEERPNWLPPADELAAARPPQLEADAPYSEDGPSAGPPPAPRPVAIPAATPVQPTATPTEVAKAGPTPVATLPVATPSPTPTAALPPEPSLVLSPREALLLDAINDVRAAGGLSPLVPRADLTEVARARSEEMIRLDYFAHFHPLGRSAYELLAEEGITFSAAGENLVKTYGDVAHSVEIGFEALMGSPGHRDNILKPVYVRVGVGSFTSDDGVTVITTIFTDR